MVAVDARSGAVAVEGWQRETDARGRRGDRRPRRGAACARFVFTPVEVDGTLAGPALDSLREAAEAAAASRRS